MWEVSSSAHRSSRIHLRKGNRLLSGAGYAGLSTIDPSIGFPYTGLLMARNSKIATTLIVILLLGAGCNNRHAAYTRVPAMSVLPPPPAPLYVELVLDRSASMMPSMRTMLQEAAKMAISFQPGRDRLGLVVFGSSGVVAYPADGSGPSADFQTSSPNLPQLIQTISAGSNTGTAEALWLAYRELTKQPDPRAPPHRIVYRWPAQRNHRGF